MVENQASLFVLLPSPLLLLIEVSGQVRVLLKILGCSGSTDVTLDVEDFSNVSVSHIHFERSTLSGEEADSVIAEKMRMILCHYLRHCTLNILT